jgi:hypothetical protein
MVCVSPFLLVPFNSHFFPDSTVETHYFSNSERDRGLKDFVREHLLTAERGFIS